MHAPDSPLLATDLVKTWGRGDTAVRALDGVSLELHAGALTAIMGASGSGKSTLLHCCAGLCDPDRGNVQLGGEPFSGLADGPRTRLRRRRLGIVFQAFNLVPTLDARDNVALPLVLDGLGEAEARRRADERLAAVGLAQRAKHRPDQLSGGEQQRVAIARALVADAPLLLADEPTGNLDSAATAVIGDLFQNLVADGKRAIGLVTHEVEVAAWADRVVVLADGKLVDDFPGTDAATIAERLTRGAAA